MVAELIAFVAVVDRLTALVRQRDDRRKATLAALVEPLYSGAEAVAKDYRLMFSKLRDNIQRDPANLKTWLDELQEARLQCKDLRLKLADLKNLYAKKSPDIKPFLDRLGELIQMPLDRSPSYFLAEVALSHLKLAEQNEVFLETVVEDVTDTVDECAEYVERSWRDLTYEYGALKLSHALPT